VEEDVTCLEKAGFEINKQIDAAYHVKYRRYLSNVDHINYPEACSATIKLVPRPTGS
jgi:hypothetical protein